MSQLQYFIIKQQSRWVCPWSFWTCAPGSNHQTIKTIQQGRTNQYYSVLLYSKAPKTKANWATSLPWLWCKPMSSKLQEHFSIKPLTIWPALRESQQLEDQQSIVPTGYWSNSPPMVTTPQNQFLHVIMLITSTLDIKLALTFIYPIYATYIQCLPLKKRVKYRKLTQYCLNDCQCFPTLQQQKMLESWSNTGLTISRTLPLKKPKTISRNAEAAIHKCSSK